MGGGCALWTTAAAALDAPPARPDPGDPVTVASCLVLTVLRNRTTPVGASALAPTGPPSVVRPSRAPPTGGGTPHPAPARCPRLRSDFRRKTTAMTSLGSALTSRNATLVEAMARRGNTRTQRMRNSLSWGKRPRSGSRVAPAPAAHNPTRCSTKPHDGTCSSAAYTTTRQLSATYAS